MLCLSVLRATEQQRDLMSYNMYFPLGLTYVGAQAVHH